MCKAQHLRKGIYKVAMYICEISAHKGLEPAQRFENKFQGWIFFVNFTCHRELNRIQNFKIGQ